ncbi:MAG: SIMPL domain-containing protein, partial [Gammaproteobacteria bacterium]
GTTVIIPAYGEVTAPNDQATAVLAIEEQDKDKAAAASRVNQKMKQGTEIVKREDPQAILKTEGYYAYPVYPEDRPQPLGAAARPRVPSSWRVGQSLEVKTTNLAHLEKTTAQVQRVLALSNLQFGLSPAATKKLDERRIAATYQNLNERIAAIAAAMGRKLGEALLDTVDFEASGNYAGNAADAAAAPMMMRAAAKAAHESVAEPSFEPGETTLQMRVVAKVRFK